MTSQTIDFLGLKILKADTLEEAKKAFDLTNLDLMEVAENLPAGFWRPLKISWRMAITEKPMLEQIRSKRARKQIRTDDKKLANLGIVIKTIPEINEETFSQWRFLYQEKMEGKEKGIVVIGADWLKQKQDQGKTFGAVLAYRGEKVIGGNLFHQIKDRLSLAYGVAERVEGLVGGLGLLLDYYSLLYAQKVGFKLIAFGQDENFYGFHLSPGLFFYKAKLGLTPVPAVKTAWATSLFLNFAKYGDQIMFFVEENGVFILNIIYKGETPPKSEDIYLPLGVKEGRIWPADEILVKHKQLLLS